MIKKNDEEKEIRVQKNLKLKQDIKANNNNIIIKIENLLKSRFNMYIGKLIW